MRNGKRAESTSAASEVQCDCSRGERAWPGFPWNALVTGKKDLGNSGVKSRAFGRHFPESYPSESVTLRTTTDSVCCQ